MEEFYHLNGQEFQTFVPEHFRAHFVSLCLYKNLEGLFHTLLLVLVLDLKEINRLEIIKIKRLVLALRNQLPFLSEHIFDLLELRKVGLVT